MPRFVIAVPPAVVVVCVPDTITCMPTLKPLKLQPALQVSVLDGDAPPLTDTLMLPDARTCFGSTTNVSVFAVPVPHPIGALPVKFMMLPTPQPGNGSEYGHVVASPKLAI